MQQNTGPLIVFAALLGLAVGLLDVLIMQSPSAVVSAVDDPTPWVYPTAPSWPAAFEISGGELVMILATEIPSTRISSATPAPAMTSTPPLPTCGTITPGQLCEWAIPSPSPTLIAPACGTPAPGQRCIWPTPTVAIPGTWSIALGR